MVREVKDGGGDALGGLLKAFNQRKWKLCGDLPALSEGGREVRLEESMKSSLSNTHLRNTEGFLPLNHRSVFGREPENPERTRAQGIKPTTTTTAQYPFRG